MSITRRAAVQSAAAIAALALAGQARAVEQRRIKVLELLARKDGTSHADFMQHWRSTHGPAAAKIPGLRGYVAQEVVSNPPLRTDIAQLNIPVDIDGIAELWFDSRKALAAAYRSAPGKAWLADKAVFVGSMKGLVGRQDVIVKLATPLPALKSNAFLTRKPGTTTAEFRKEWHAVHGTMAVKVPLLRGFILLDVLDTETAQGIPLIQMADVDGVAETYFTSHEEQLQMIATPEAKAWFAQGATTFGQIKSYNTAATVFVPPVAA